MNLLKKQGAVDADELASRVGLSTSAVRQQLTALQPDGLVTFDEVKHGVGRPRHHYGLTSAGDSLFPRAYAELTNELLDYVGEADPELVETIFPASGDRQRRCPGQEEVGGQAGRAGPDPRRGRLPRRESSRGRHLRIIEHNCAILGVAMRYGQACSSELEFIRQVLPDATVDAPPTWWPGAFNCSYLVTPR